MTWRDLMCGEVGLRARRQRRTLAGWVDTRRDHGGLVFVDLRDASGVCQLVVNPERAPEAPGGAHAIRNEFVLRAEGEVVRRAPENVNPEPAHGRGRAPGRRARDRLALDAAAVPARRGGCGRDAAPALSLARPAAAADAAEHRAAGRHGLDHPARNGGRRLPRHPDADPLQADAGGRARLHRPEPAAAGPLLRAAAVAADPQAAARHRRVRPLLPDRASASGTRISAPTASRRSRSSTSRWRFPTRSTSSRSWSGCAPPSGARASAPSWRRPSRA